MRKEQKRCDLYFTDNEDGTFAFAVLKRCRKKSKAKFVAALIHAVFARKGIETPEDLEQMDDHSFQKLIDKIITFGPKQDTSEEMLSIIRMLVAQGSGSATVTKTVTPQNPIEENEQKGTDTAEESNRIEKEEIPEEESMEDPLSGLGFDDLNMDMINAALNTMKNS